MSVPLCRGYVDDGRQGTSKMKEGTRFNKEKKKFEAKEEWKEEDRMLGETTLTRMSRVCREAMNGINDDLKFTTETSEDYKDGKLPTLDFAAEVNRGIISHTYYEKPMKTQLVLMARSAMGQSQKYQIMSNELIRRLEKVSEGMPRKEVTRIIEQYTRQLKNSGYCRKEAREVIVSGVKGHKKRRAARMRQAGGKCYRKAASTLKSRCKKKLTAKTTWYKQKRQKEKAAWDEEDEEEWKREERLVEKEIQGSTKVKAVIFVPQTKGSRLAKSLREKELELEKLSGWRFKIVERAGEKLENILHQSNPWSGQDCERKGCLMCKTKAETGKNTRQNCSKRNVLYETWCETCLKVEEEKVAKVELEGGEKGSKKRKKNEEIQMVKYVGESARSCHERGTEHLSDMLNLRTTSHLLKHYLTSHEGEEINSIVFRMKAVKFHKNAFERQIHESVRIQSSRNKHILLNSKAEYNRSHTRGDKKGLRQCAKLQDLGGGDCDYCDCDCCYGGKVKSHPTS